jgi:nitrite reductase/ring-hydroxylating ferredoxin subunit
MKERQSANDPAAYADVWSAPRDALGPGRSAKFHIIWRERLVEGFVVNFDGRYYAYLNYCAHAGTPLDWWPNEFFDPEGRLLTCGTHGSLYEPDTGKCAGGPCAGGALFRLKVRIVDDRIVVSASGDVQNPLSGPAGLQRHEAK